MEIAKRQKIEDARNYAQFYRKELKNLKKLKNHLNLEKENISDLKSSLKKSGFFGKNLEGISSVSSELLFNQKKEQIYQVQKAQKNLDDINTKYSLIKGELLSKSPKKDPNVYEFLKRNNSEQRNPVKRFFGISKDFKKVTSKDLEFLLPELKKEYDKIRIDAEKKVEDLKKEGLAIDDAMTLKRKESMLHRQKEMIQDSKETLKELSKPILKLIESIVDLNLKEIKAALKATNPLDLAAFIKESFSKYNSNRSDKVINLGEKLDKIGKEQKPEKALKL